MRKIPCVGARAIIRLHARSHRILLENLRRTLIDENAAE